MKEKKTTTTTITKTKVVVCTNCGGGGRIPNPKDLTPPYIFCDVCDGTGGMKITITETITDPIL